MFFRNLFQDLSLSEDESLSYAACNSEISLSYSA